ncbi:MAG: hypothetical protein KAY24_04675 [Candidatus Eisenbacteria sp.]|nr:hypothetical protein [Candidatus Eisenbacteria bacterium]
MDVEIDFLDDWRLILLQRLEAAGAPAALPAETAREVAKQCFNLVRRLIPRRPRRVLRSREFSCHSHRMEGLQLLESKIASGGDLNPHLSTRLEKPWFNDALLNDWDIQHFHLGERAEALGLVGRTGELLFARVTSEKVYLIDVRDHQSFSDRALLGILQSNWPDMMSTCSLPRVRSLPVDSSTMDITKLRKAGIDPIVQVPSGGVYMPLGGGVVTSGTSAEVMRLVIEHMNVIEGCEDVAKARVSEIVVLAAQAGTDLRPPIQLRLDLEGEAVWSREEVTGVRIQLGCLSQSQRILGGQQGMPWPAC